MYFSLFHWSSDCLLTVFQCPYSDAVAHAAVEVLVEGLYMDIVPVVLLQITQNIDGRATTGHRLCDVVVIWGVELLIIGAVDWSIFYVVSLNESMRT